jgi:hypothetical protein
MRALIRPLVCLMYLSLACVHMSAAVAADAPESPRQIGDLVKSAREQISLIRNELEQVDRDLGSTGNASRSAAGATGAAGAAGATEGFWSGHARYSELKRYAETLADIGNDVARFTSKCVGEAQEVAGKFRSQTSRLRSNVGQLESASASMAEMSISKMRRDLDAIENQLQSVAGMGGSCGN